MSTITEKIRSIHRALVQAESRYEIEQQVCDALVDVEQFTFAWIGEPNLATDELTVKAQAGAHGDYLDAVSLSLDDERGLPASRVVRDRETVTITSLVDDLQREPWRNEALGRGFRSVVSVPLLHDGVLYGVLSIYLDESGASTRCWSRSSPKPGRSLRTRSTASNSITRSSATVRSNSRSRCRTWETRWSNWRRPSTQNWR
ncbi:GAF domain-containing protein [Haloarculaceae archaeon H-GB11]|nr:GAF domain-containing protein [Haloarculaceae archaeon H-GB11]